MRQLSAIDLSWLASLGLGELCSVKVMQSGITNKVFLLQYQDNQRYIFKRLNADARSSGERKREFFVQQLANEFGLSTKVIATNRLYRLQEYFDGKSLSIKHDVNLCIEVLASHLTKIHRLPALYAPLQDLSGQLQSFYEKLDNCVDQSLFNQYFQQAKWLDSESQCDTLCHGDLSRHNLLLGKNEQVKAIDWEYAVLACPAYDLASCIAINQFNDAQMKLLIESYYALNNKTISTTLAIFAEQTQSYLSVFTYLNQLWSRYFQAN